MKQKKVHVNLFMIYFYLGLKNLKIEFQLDSDNLVPGCARLVTSYSAYNLGLYNIRHLTKYLSHD